MMSKKRISLIIILVLVISLLGMGILSNYHHGKSKYKGKHNILVLCADPTEQRAGIGAIDMAFIIELNNGKLGEITPIYPGGLYDPSLTPPSDLQNEGADHWYLHDSLWTSDLNDGTARAQQIVEYNTNIKSDIVAVVTPDAVDAMINAVGPVYTNGQKVTNDSLSLLRSEQRDNGASRGDAIGGLANGILNATKKNGKQIDLIFTIIDQYNKGNISVVPNDAFQKLVSYVGVSSVFS